jgi:hypothetical protein
MKINIKMKIFSLLFSLLLAQFAIAQMSKEQVTTMSLGQQNGFYITVDGANKSILEDAWKEYVKEYGKSKKNNKAKEMITEKAKVPFISSGDIILYARHEEGVGQGTTYLWVDNGKGFISSKSDASAANGAQTFLNDFWLIARKKAIGKEMELEEKKAKELAKELDKLKDKKKDNDQEIEKCKKKIIELEQENIANGKEQYKKTTEIDRQNSTINLVKDKLNNVGKSRGQ